MDSYTPPAFKKECYHCPWCHAYSAQSWTQAQANAWGIGPLTAHRDLYLSYCLHCRQYCLWYKERMLLPDSASIPPPNPDLDRQGQNDYLEAAAVFHKSPRSASALLRLCIWKLCKQLGEPGESLQADIATLARRGLGLRIQQALEAVRVIGPQAARPGVLDKRDTAETATQLFGLVNLMARRLLSEPREDDALLRALPQTSLKALEHTEGLPQTD